MQNMHTTLNTRSSIDAVDNNILQTAIQNNVRNAFAEDIGQGDLTAQLVPAGQSAQASIISRQSAIICGIAWAELCFKSLDADVQIEWHVADGDRIRQDQVLCTISGNARTMLTAERCALNFLQALSATATSTRVYVDAIAGTLASILDTRKTLPGLRMAQKYAVRVGGGINQRLGLDGGILIKENHISAAGSIEAVLQTALALTTDKNVAIQIEVETLTQLEIALDAEAKLILLDNFNVADLIQAVNMNGGRAILEASGGIDLSNVREIALTGVDRISIGSLTKNISAVDLSMRVTS
jgi:nicotinate-nucleotide pyrophosphorylase (carboxylating)